MLERLDKNCRHFLLSIVNSLAPYPRGSWPKVVVQGLDTVTGQSCGALRHAYPRRSVTNSKSGMPICLI
jgi:hypothetical protein